MKTIYMQLKYFTGVLCLSVLMCTSCADLDVPPINVVQDADVFANENTTFLYLARLYSQMPFEDFKYSTWKQFFDSWLAIPDVTTGNLLQREDHAPMTREGYSRNGAYWARGFSSLRDANYLLETLPAYKANLSETFYNHCLGEAYFTRAMVFYTLVKRYGGVPLVLEVLKYPDNDVAALEVPRASEEETWEQVLKDFDEAIRLLMPASPKRGLASKDVALAFKSEAMLYAGTVAKYNRITGFGQKVNTRLIGFDPSTQADVSKKYLIEAYNASRELIKGNKYALYKKKWAAGDREAQYQNMVDLFFDAQSPENIYIVEYQYPYTVHGYDCYAVPFQLMGGNGYSAYANPTLDFVEMFDGLPKNPDGTFKVFDEHGKYILYDHPLEPFRNAEPRLRAYVVFPYDLLKGSTIEIRRGVYTGEVGNGIESLMSKNGVVSYDLSVGGYQLMDAYTGNGKFNGQKALHMCNTSTVRDFVDMPDGSRMTGSAVNGPFNSDNRSAFTGFTIRKWIDPNLPAAMVLEGRSEQHFIVMRYAEILLNIAEAAAELKLAGVAAPDGEDLTQVAYDAVRDIRERAGADPLKSVSELEGQSGLELIRKERRKELAFEHKTQWDLRRWRIEHSEWINGRTKEDGAYYRSLYPFYSLKADKWFFDARLDERQWTFTIKEDQYYLLIPSGEVTKSPVIDQQPGR